PADSTNVPAAIRPFAAASRRALASRTRSRRAALHSAPPRSTEAPTPDRVAANTRGRGPNTSDPWGIAAAGTGPRSGAANPTPPPNATATVVTNVAIRATGGRASRYQVPRASTGTLITAPNA